MAIPTVWSVRELRERLSVAIASAGRGKVVFAGAYRQAEVALISVERYRELTETESSGNPFDPEDEDAFTAPAPEEEVLSARALARNEISYYEYMARIRTMLEKRANGAD